MTPFFPGGREALRSRDACHRLSPAAQDAVLREDREVVDAILAGNEAAFLALATRWHSSMVRVARCYVVSDAVAEAVARSAWRAVLEGLAGWQARVSLVSFICGIVASRARTRAALEHAAPVPSFHDAPRDAGPGPDNEGFSPGDTPAWGARLQAGEWSAERLESLDARAALQKAVDALPPMQRLVFTVRDVVGCTSDEVGDALGLSEVEQRVLLHRARSRVRAAMQSHLSFGGEVSRGALQEPR